MKGGVELDSSYHSKSLSGLKISFKSGKEMVCVDTDVDKDVESLDFRDIDRYKATVSVMHQEVAAQSSGGIIINTASPVGHITHNKGINFGAKSSKNIGDGGGKY